MQSLKQRFQPNQSKFTAVKMGHYQMTVLRAHFSTKRRQQEKKKQLIESQPRNASLTLVIKIVNGTREYREYSLMSCDDSLFRSPGYMQ